MNLMAAALTRMVEEWVEMHGRKVKMEEEMLQYLMQQMQTGKESMTQRPNDAGDEGTISPLMSRSEKKNTMGCPAPAK